MFHFLIKKFFSAVTFLRKNNFEKLIGSLDIHKVKLHRVEESVHRIKSRSYLNSDVISQLRVENFTPVESKFKLYKLTGCYAQL